MVSSTGASFPALQTDTANGNLADSSLSAWPFDPGLPLGGYLVFDLPPSLARHPDKLTLQLPHQLFPKGSEISLAVSRRNRRWIGPSAIPLPTPTWPELSAKPRQYPSSAWHLVVPQSGGSGLAYDPRGQVLWYLSGGGDYFGEALFTVSRYDPATGQTKTFYLPPVRLGNTEESGLAMAPDGSIWIGECFSLLKLNPVSGHVDQYPLPKLAGQASDPRGNDGQTEIMGLAVTPNGRIWFTRANAYGIGYFDPASRRFGFRSWPRSFGLPGNLYLAPNGQLWATTWSHQGFLRGPVYATLRIAPATGKVAKFTGPGSKLAFGPGGRVIGNGYGNAGLTLLSPKTGRLSNDPHLSGFAADLVAYGRGGYWVVRPGNNSIVYYKPDRKLWAEYFSPMATAPTSFSLIIASQPIYDLVVDPTGRLWISSNDGIAYLDPESAILPKAVPALPANDESTARELGKASFFDANTAFLPLTFENGTMAAYVTTDAGRTWQGPFSITYSVAGGFGPLRWNFRNQQNGSVTYKGRTLTTMDEGLDWMPSGSHHPIPERSSPISSGDS